MHMSAHVHAVVLDRCDHHLTRAAGVAAVCTTMHAWYDYVVRLPSVRDRWPASRAARAACPECEGGRQAGGRRAPACMSGVGWGAAWRAKALLHEARMLKRLTYRSDGEQQRAGREVGARKGQAGGGQVRRVLRAVRLGSGNMYRVGRCRGFESSWAEARQMRKAFESSREGQGV